METATTPPKTVRLIPATYDSVTELKKAYKQLRVAAYCRVSTKQEEQLNSYEVQKRYYTEKINSEPKWTLVEIYADKGITGTSTKNRDEFNRMIRTCKRGKIDMIIVKSISRFARNTLDCIKYIRMLKEIGVDVFFEEQGIHSSQEGAEFYITIYGSIARSESENMSANIKWGKAQSAKEGKVVFHYKNFMGYRKGTDGNPEIDPEGAEVIRYIYNRYLAGDSAWGIVRRLNALKIPTPSGKENWRPETVRSILQNERYIGDAIINKTYITDCISKQVRINTGQRPKYYVENNHPAIIDAVTFNRVQEEMARRAGKRRMKLPDGKTELGKYSSKYALNDLLICAECGSSYMRRTWCKKNSKKVMWRCASRLNFGKQYCNNSPSIEEGALHRAIMAAIMKQAKESTSVLNTLKMHIAMGLNGNNNTQLIMEYEVRIAEIDATFQRMLKAVSLENADYFDDEKLEELMIEKRKLQKQIDELKASELHRKNTESRIDDIGTILDGLRNHPLEYNDQIVRQVLGCIRVENKELITVVFVGGLEVKQMIEYLQ